jgi:P4 family phage/plasmid primase-like protien
LIRKSLDSTFECALEYHRRGFSVIPLIPKTKRAAISWEHYQTIRPDEEQVQKWFEKTQNVNGIALVTGKVSGLIELDIDGEAARAYFHDIVEKINDAEINHKIKNTMKIKTGGGNLNYIFAISVADFVGDKIRTSILWRGKQGHNEITLKGDGGYAVAPPSEHPSGNRYGLVDGNSSPSLLSKQQLMQLVAALKQQGKKTSARNGSNTKLTSDIENKKITQIVSLIKPYYHLGSRNGFLMYLSGWLRKEGITIGTARELIQRICGDDEEKNARLRTLEETYQKEAVNDLKGYSGILELLKDELGDEIKARTFLGELQNLLEQIQKKDDKDELLNLDQEQISIVEEASEAILTKHRLLTIEETKDILYYRNGVYVPGGEILIEKEAERIYGYQLSNRHLSEIKGHIIRSTYHTHDEFDSDLNIINLKNGLYNLQTGGFKEHTPDLFTGLLTSLHGSKNISNVPLSSMLEDRFALSDLEGKAVNIDTELTSATIRDASILKKLTGGQATRIQRKNQRAYDALLYAKLVFSANRIPSSNDESDAYFRRKVILGFPNRFEGNRDDPDLIKKLTTEEELSGILNVLLIALRRALNRNGIFVKEKTIEQRRERYVLAASPIEAFLDDAVAEDSVESDEVPKEEFYQAYKRFCNDHRLAILSKEPFGKNLKRQVGKWKLGERREASGERRTLWTGVKLAEKYHVELRQETLNV